ncbi:hypothetical protein Btru_033538 [Bulinus truncatus]|nr:hypothetical protein Btru_033538 [Bulinus truncatus]
MLLGWKDESGFDDLLSPAYTDDLSKYYVTKMNRALMLRALIISSLLASGLGIVCISNTGTPVDWYIVYKLPMNSNSHNSNERSGKAYYYMDENDKSFQLQTHAIDDMNTPMANTLKPIYANPNTKYIMYNDHMTSSQTYGHLKGVVAKFIQTGFFLLHSVPNYPPPRANTYSWPSNGYTNGQILLCISFKSNQYDSIVTHIKKSRPYIYDSNPKQSMTNSRIPSLRDMLLGWRDESKFDDLFSPVDSFYDWNTKPDTVFNVNYPLQMNGFFDKEMDLLSTLFGDFSMLNKHHVYRRCPTQFHHTHIVPPVDLLNIVSINLKTFTGYSKPRPKPNEDGIDIYEFLADTLQQNLHVQTWQNGQGGKLNSSCNQYEVENIVEIDIETSKFSSSKDHSKWARTMNANKPLFVLEALTE